MSRRERECDDRDRGDESNQSECRCRMGTRVNFPLDGDRQHLATGNRDKVSEGKKDKKSIKKSNSGQSPLPTGFNIIIEDPSKLENDSVELTKKGDSSWGSVSSVILKIGQPPPLKAFGFLIEDPSKT